MQNLKVMRILSLKIKDTPENLEDKNVKAISSTGVEVITGVKITPDTGYNS